MNFIWKFVQGMGSNKIQFDEHGIPYDEDKHGVSEIIENFEDTVFVNQDSIDQSGLIDKMLTCKYNTQDKKLSAYMNANWERYDKYWKDKRGINNITLTNSKYVQQYISDLSNNLLQESALYVYNQRLYLFAKNESSSYIIYWMEKGVKQIPYDMLSIEQYIKDNEKESAFETFVKKSDKCKQETLLKEYIMQVRKEHYDKYWDDKHYLVIPYDIEHINIYLNDNVNNLQNDYADFVKKNPVLCAISSDRKKVQYDLLADIAKSYFNYVRQDYLYIYREKDHKAIYIMKVSN